LNSSKKILLFIFILSLVIASCASGIRYSSVSGGVKKSKVSTNDSALTETLGFASYYAYQFHGKKTSSGEFYDMNDLTAAHLKLPFGTKVQVRNIKNNRTVIVRINDRGPFVDGRIIDLSKAAAEELDMINDGVTEVELTIVSYP
jgi:rare lipoprotein A